MLDNDAGVDFKVKVLEATGSDGITKRVKITIWDTGEIILILQITGPQIQRTTCNEVLSFYSWTRKISNTYQLLLSWCTGNHSR